MGETEGFHGQIAARKNLVHPMVRLSLQTRGAAHFLQDPLHGLAHIALGFSAPC